MPIHFKAILLSFVILVATSSVYSQVSDKRKEVAEKFVKQADLVMESTAAKQVAKELYIQAARIDPKNVEANFKAGQLILATIDKNRAAPYFLTVKNLDPDYYFSIDYLIGRSYHLGLRFDEAIDYYQKYQQKISQNPAYSGEGKVDEKEVKRRIEECYNGKEFIANPREYAVKNMGASVNSVYDDYAPVINREGTLMIFTSRRKEGNMSTDVDIDNEPFEDVYYSENTNGEWQEASNLGTPINTEFHNSNLSLSADGKILFLYTDNNNGDILVSRKSDDGKWSQPQSIGPNINSLGYKESSVSLSPNGDTLYFASNRPGGYGGSDIYYSVKDKRGNWKTAKNLGSVINTEFDDDGPFLDFTGNYLYFSSKGHKGMGGYDIYKSEYLPESKSWSEPENMGYPINTSDDDIYFVISDDGQKAYYATVRGGAFGLSDIYSIEKGKFGLPGGEDSTLAEKPVKKQPSGAYLVNLIVKDAQGNALDADVNFRKLEGKINAPVRRLKTGIYQIQLEKPGSELYLLTVQKDGYAFINERMDFEGSFEESTETEKVVIMDILEIGTRHVLRNVYFDFNEAVLKESSYEELDKLKNMLDKNPGVEIELGGHTDNVGDAAFNKQLSKKRVEAAKKYLVQKGIESSRISTVGYGEERPLASNDDEKEGRELNRRVEFTVTKK